MVMVVMVMVMVMMVMVVMVMAVMMVMMVMVLVVMVVIFSPLGFLFQVINLAVVGASQSSKTNPRTKYVCIR